MSSALLRGSLTKASVVLGVSFDSLGSNKWPFSLLSGSLLCITDSMHMVLFINLRRHNFKELAHFSAVPMSTEITSGSG